MTDQNWLYSELQRAAEAFQVVPEYAKPVLTSSALTTESDDQSAPS